MPRPKKIRFILLGFIGFAGMLGFRYFFSGNPADLFFFACFTFFAFWILGEIEFKLQDDKWRENFHKASTLAFWVAMAFLFLIGIFSSWSLLSQELVITGCALGWSTSILTYATALRVYERR